ncbi:hypothetical protein [Candidatus Formimonas warabiya]|uniref:hypothetical protein n=1 Tax=Formimonas warabiya TaxID=1761012 RepID=UPI001BE42639|nr:hypothetical protein [Candidatus Formimonas warabiya]
MMIGENTGNNLYGIFHILFLVLYNDGTHVRFGRFCPTAPSFTELMYYSTIPLGNM